MMILTDIGEIGIHEGAVCHKLRPSLYAISQLGTPEEIVDLYARVMGANPRFADALHVIFCCAESDVSHIFGHLGEDLKFVPGKAPPDHAVHIARALLRHGVTSVLPPQGDPKDEDYTPRFVAREHVAVAMAHLGASSIAAWQMTMTELVGAMRAKFPPLPELDKKGKPRPPKMTAKEYDETMEYGDAVMAAMARRKKKGGK